MKKRMTSLLLAGAMLLTLSLTGCQPDSPSGENSQQPGTETSGGEITDPFNQGGGSGGGGGGA